MTKKKEEAHEPPYNIIIRIRLCKLHKEHFGKVKDYFTILGVLKFIKACPGCKLEVINNE